MEHQQKHRGLFIVSLLLAIAGVALSFLSLQQHVLAKANPSYSSFCDITATMNCSAVATSTHALLLGIPIASYGIVFYAVIGFLASLGAFTTLPVLGPLLVLSLFSVALSLYLFFISSFVIKALCLLCILLYVVNVGLALLSVFMARKAFTATFTGGIRGVLGYPKILLGKGSPQASAALVGFLFTVIIAAATLQLPRFMTGSAKTSTRTSIASEVVASVVREWELQSPIPGPKPITEGPGKDYTLGPVDAPVTLLEFSDFECPACQKVYPLLKDIFSRYKDKVYFIFKNYPLDMECNPNFDQPAHENACFAATMARCAGEQGKFWEAADILFDPAVYELGSSDVVRGEMGRRVERVGVSLKTLDECVASGRHKEKILSDVKEGDSYQLRGTPTIWINGKKISSLRPDVIEAVIQKALGVAP